MADYYGRFDHPYLDELPPAPAAGLFSEMTRIADELRANPRHVPADDRIAFRQLQQRRRAAPPSARPSPSASALLRRRR